MSEPARIFEPIVSVLTEHQINVLAGIPEGVAVEYWALVRNRPRIDQAQAQHALVGLVNTGRVHVYPHPEMVGASMVERGPHPFGRGRRKP